MRHRFHALCPYFAMFPEAFARRWVDELTEPGDLVVDPFCGRGTAPFEALLAGRRAMGNDINPVAYCVSRAKTNAPARSVLRQRITWLENRYHATEWEQGATGLPEFFHFAFNRNTLRQLLYLRRSLRWRRSDVDCMIGALILGSLHGESNRSERYLSNQMPRTISTKPAYSVRYWKERSFRAPGRDVFELLREMIEFRYRSDPPVARAEVVEGDFRNLIGRFRLRGPQARLLLTSPPYLDTTNFEEDQWLRLWFLGGPAKPTYCRISRDDRYESRTSYWRLIADFWRLAGLSLAKDGFVVIRLGGKGLSQKDIVAGLKGAALFAGRRVTLESVESSPIRRKQTVAFRPGSKGRSLEVDCCFRVH